MEESKQPKATGTWVKVSLQLTTGSTKIEVMRFTAAVSMGESEVVVALMDFRGLQ
jgi:hypothetical protein